MTAALATGTDSRRRTAAALRAAGWTLITAGVVVVLYLVYSLLYTNLETDAAQARLLEAWDRRVPAVAEATPSPTPERTLPTPEDPDNSVDGAVAVLEFVRPSGGSVVRDGPLAVVAGVTMADLARGPGHYPGSAAPGESGNFAVAGHRTTHGAPFFNLDELAPGDELHVRDTRGVRHVYRFVRLEVVAPTDVWVVGPNPLGTSKPTLTLTTCHPRFSARQRLVAFAELVEP